MAVRLTDGVIRGLPVPVRGNKITYDTELKGFGLRVTGGDARSFVLGYRTTGGRERRYTIGGFPNWSATAAPKRARELRAFIDQGGDPLAEIEASRAAPTFAELCDRFEAEHVPRKRPGTAANYRSVLTRHVRPFFGAHTKITDVTFADVDALHRKITAAGHLHRANTTIRIVSRMFALAIRWGWCDANPCRGIERNVEEPRKRYLTTAEMARLTVALTSHPDRQAANIILLLLLTGARKGEVLSMRWADLNLDNSKWTKPARITKQKRTHTVPLSAAAQRLLADIRAGSDGYFRAGAQPGMSSRSSRNGVRSRSRRVLPICAFMICGIPSPANWCPKARPCRSSAHCSAIPIRTQRTATAICLTIRCAPPSSGSAPSSRLPVPLPSRRSRRRNGGLTARRISFLAKTAAEIRGTRQRCGGRNSIHG